MTPHWWYRDLYYGDSGQDVRVVQLKLGAALTGTMDGDTLALIRGFQRSQGLETIGVVDHSTAVSLGEPATYGLVPTWYTTGNMEGLRVALHVSPWVGLDDSIRRFQSAHGHFPTGELSEQLAIEIGD